MRLSFLSRKEEIILTTIDLMDELGPNNVSIKDIAGRVKVTDAALYKHFRSKEEIYLGVFEYYAKYDDYIIHTVEQKQCRIREKIFSYFQMYAEYYSGYPAVTAVLGMCILLLYHEEFTRVINAHADKRTAFLTGLLERGVEEGEFIPAASTEYMAYTLTGTFEKIIYVWRQKRYQFDLKEKIEKGIGGLLDLYDKKG